MKIQTTLLAGALLLGGASASQAQVAVQLNGQPLAVSQAPVTMNGRTLVPLRDIFEALGAQVNYNPTYRTISAVKGSTNIQLTLNTPTAFVDGRAIQLDQPPTVMNGRTLVPLRFVAEATGANVDWNGAMQLVSIRTPNLGFPGTPVVTNPVITNPIVTNPNTAFPTPNTNVVTPGSQVAGYRQISIPARVVVPVELNEAISSKDTRVGERFSATVVSRRLGDSEFPANTRLEGVVTESRPAEKGQPGVLDFEFQTAILPDGTRIPLRGRLTSLDAKNVDDQNGRLVARGARGHNDDLKIIGIGAGAGYVIGELLNTNTTVSTILGAAGGYLYSRSRERAAEEARLAKGTTLGVELVDRVSYVDTADYGRFREVHLRDSDTRFNAQDYGFDPRVAVSSNDVGRTDIYPGYEVSNQLPAPAPFPNDIVANDGLTRDERREQRREERRNERFGDVGTDVRDANFGRISIPAGAVVPVRVNERITSETARVGEIVTTTVESQRVGDSEFPNGTRIYGRVTEVQQRRGDQPGVLNFRFTEAVLPSGERVNLRGSLISLDDKSVQTQNGRLIAKNQSNGVDLKVIGIGAAAGYAIGRILDKDGLLPTLLGALGGFIYSQSKGDKPAEAVLPEGARLGVRLDNGVTFNDDTYYTYRNDYLRLN